MRSHFSAAAAFLLLASCASAAAADGPRPRSLILYTGEEAVVPEGTFVVTRAGGEELVPAGAATAANWRRPDFVPASSKPAERPGRPRSLLLVRDEEFVVPDGMAAITSVGGGQQSGPISPPDAPKGSGYWGGPWATGSPPKGNPWRGLPHRPGGVPVKPEDGDIITMPNVSPRPGEGPYRG